jgi:hypothetical protein
MACTSIAVTMATTAVAASTSAIATILGTRWVQSGAAVASTISCSRRSRSRQTSSPA